MLAFMHASPGNRPLNRLRNAARGLVSRAAPLDLAPAAPAACAPLSEAAALDAALRKRALERRLRAGGLSRTASRAAVAALMSNPPVMEPIDDAPGPFPVHC